MMNHNQEPKGNRAKRLGRSRLSKKAAIVAAGSLSVVGLLGGAAFASGTVPGSGGVINACYQNHSGNLSVLLPNGGKSDQGNGDHSGGCGKDQTPISWNQAGAQGPQGAIGKTGAQGPQGATGAQGPQGAIGKTGAQGPQGANGTQGLSGAQGPQGAKGASGAQGSQGAQGPAGTQGPQGPSGASNIDVQTAVFTVPGNDSLTGLNAACPSGQVATGGGVSFSPGSSEAFITEDSPSAFAPNGAPNGWVGGLNNTNSLAQVLTVYAVCVTP